MIFYSLSAWKCLSEVACLGHNQEQVYSLRILDWNDVIVRENIHCAHFNLSFKKKHVHEREERSLLIGAPKPRAIISMSAYNRKSSSFSKFISMTKSNLFRPYFQRSGCLSIRHLSLNATNANKDRELVIFCSRLLHCVLEPRSDKGAKISALIVHAWKRELIESGLSLAGETKLFNSFTESPRVKGQNRDALK